MLLFANFSNGHMNIYNIIFCIFLYVGNIL